MRCLTEEQEQNLPINGVAGAIGRLVTDQDCTQEQETQADRSNEVYRLSRNEHTYEVTVDSDVSLEDYRQLTPKQDWELLVSTVEKLHGKSIVFINPTMEGGGVAMLRPPVVHMLKLLGVDAHWYVMQGRGSENDPDPFVVTKKMHNISQRRTAPDEFLTEEDKSIHWSWNAQNAAVLSRQEVIQRADVVFIDDPQPAPLKTLLAEAVKPSSKWLWRNHIDTHAELMADPATPQGGVAAYILQQCGIQDVDAVIAHPVEQFIHPGMSEKTYFGPATTDPFDDLNRRLNPSEIHEGLQFINTEIDAKNAILRAEGREEDIQSRIDMNRKRIVLVARFDESKGMDKAMKLGCDVRKLLRQRGYEADELPQVVLVGNGSVDDPSGVPMYEEMLRLRREQFSEDSEDIVIMRLRHNYTAMNALMYPTGGLDGSDTAQIVGVQTSEAEGCETRISDWIRHGVPAVVFNNGGMPLQVQEGVSGYVLDYQKRDHDMQRGAEIISALMSDPKEYARMRASSERAAIEFNDREFTTTANVTRIARTIARSFEGKAADKVWKIADMVR